MLTIQQIGHNHFRVIDNDNRTHWKGTEDACNNYITSTSSIKKPYTGTKSTHTTSSRCVIKRARIPRVTKYRDVVIQRMSNKPLQELLGA